MPSRYSDQPGEWGDETPFDLDTAAPFDEDSLYIDGELRSRRGSLLHLMQTGRHIIVIEGEPETGRTTLLGSLVDDRDGLIMPLPLAPEDLNDAEALADACIQGFDLPTPPVPAGERVITHAEESLARLLQDGERPVLLIDDADDLDPDSLRALLDMRLAARHEGGPTLGLVLIGRRGFAPRLLDLAGPDLAPADIHVAALHAWREDQVADYIAHELGADASGAPLDPRFDPAEIHQESQGLPGRVRAACQRRWYSLDAPVASGKRPLPWPPSRQALLLGGGIVAAALLALLLLPFFGGGNGDMEEIALERPTATPAPDATIDEPETIPEDPLLAAEPDETMREGLDGLPEETPEAEEPAIAERPADPLMPEDSADVEADGPTLAAEPEELTPAPAEEPEEIVEAPPPPEPPADSEAEVEQPEPEQLGWLERQPGENYTIQLIAAGQREALERYLDNELAGVDNTHLIATQRDGSDWYVVVSGSHGSREAARDALNALPANLREQGAWVRSIESLR